MTRFQTQPWPRAAAANWQTNSAMAMAHTSCTARQRVCDSHGRRVGHTAQGCHPLVCQCTSEHQASDTGWPLRAATRLAGSHQPSCRHLMPLASHAVAEKGSSTGAWLHERHEVPEQLGTISPSSGRSCCAAVGQPKLQRTWVQRSKWTVLHWCCSSAAHRSAGGRSGEEHNPAVHAACRRPNESMFACPTGGSAAWVGRLQCEEAAERCCTSQQRVPT